MASLGGVSRAVRRLAWLFASVLSVWACSASEPRENVGKVEQALELQVSSEIDLEPQVTMQNNNGVGWPACADDVCFVLYDEILVSGERHLFGTRVTSAGVVLDSPRIYFGVRRNTDTPLVTSNGTSEFLVVWSSVGDGVHASRVNADSGALSSTRIMDSWPIDPKLESDGTSYALFYGAPQVVRTLVGTTLGPEVSVPPAGTNGSYHALVPGSGQYLLVGVNSSNAIAARFDPAQNAFLDSTPIIYTKYSYGTAVGTFVGGNYVLGWIHTNTSNIRALRIAPNGTVLDADDDFNALPRSHVICACAGILAPQKLQVFRRGGNAVLTWWYRPIGLPNSQIVGARVDPATGNPIAVTNYEFHIADHPSTSYDLYMNDYAGFLNLNTSLRSATWADMPFDIALGGFLSHVAFSTLRRSPSVASNGRDFVVAWTTNNRVWALRIDGVTKAALDAAPIDVGAGTSVAVSSDGTNYMLFFSGGTTLERRILRANGSLDAALTPSLYASGNFEWVHSVFNGTYYAVAWKNIATIEAIYALRVTTAGAAVSPTPTDVSSTDPQSFAIAADTTPIPTLRTFMPVWRDIGSGLRVSRFRSDTGSVFAPTTLANNAVQTRARATSDGISVLAAWMTSANLRLVEVDPVSAMPQAFSVDVPRGTELLSQVHSDGRSYVVLLESPPAGAGRLRPTRALRARRYTHDGAALESSALSLSTLVNVDHNPLDEVAVAANGNGLSLVVYQVVDVARSGVTLRGRFLDNDGLAAPGQGGNGGGGGQAGAGGRNPFGGAAGAGVGGAGAGGAAAGAAGAQAGNAGAGGAAAGAAGAGAGGAAAGVGGAGAGAGGAAAGAGGAGAGAGGATAGVGGGGAGAGGASAGMGGATAGAAGAGVGGGAGGAAAGASGGGIGGMAGVGGAGVGGLSGASGGGAGGSAGADGGEGGTDGGAAGGGADGGVAGEGGEPTGGTAGSGDGGVGGEGGDNGGATGGASGSGGSGAAGGSGGGNAGNTTGGTSSKGSSEADEDSGCGCRTQPARDSRATLLAVGLLAAFATRRRRRRAAS